MHCWRRGFSSWERQLARQIALRPLARLHGRDPALEDVLTACRVIAEHCRLKGRFEARTGPIDRSLFVYQRQAVSAKAVSPTAKD